MGPAGTYKTAWGLCAVALGLAAAGVAAWAYLMGVAGVAVVVASRMHQDVPMAHLHRIGLAAVGAIWIVMGVAAALRG
jgi:hypothetical protein